MGGGGSGAAGVVGSGWWRAQCLAGRCSVWRRDGEAREPLDQWTLSGTPRPPGVILPLCQVVGEEEGREGGRGSHSSRRKGGGREGGGDGGRGVVLQSPPSNLPVRECSAILQVKSPTSRLELLKKKKKIPKSVLKPIPVRCSAETKVKKSLYT